MYTSFFNFHCKPFQLTPDPEFLFLSKVHKRALTYFNYGITDSNTGFILITGEVGTGKTTIIRNIMRGLKGDIRLARIDNTKVTSEQLISMINEDFGLDTSGKDKTRMISDLTDFLINEYARGRRSMLIIDEAQNLSSDMLEEIRLLSNLETDKTKLLQIVLVGQPELRNTLALPELRQLRQRINISCHIQSLTVEETREYILHRLEVAGNRDAVSFEEGAVESIHNFSRGTPRLINIICDFLLLSAFIEKTKEVSTAMVNELVGQIETENRYWQDEAAKKQSPGTPGVLKEMLARLVKLEETAYRWEGPSFPESDELPERLSRSEELMKSSLAEFRAELKDSHSKSIYLMKEMEGVKQKIAELEKKENPETKTNNKRKKNLWERIFN
ncbi:MAG TPA: XrtA/PEP-CTERM system-associated ATPase [Dissulfurispiraceae bacterium]